MIAATVFGHWRANSLASSAPRQSVAPPPTPPAHAFTPKVLKKLSRFIPTTVSEPPTEGVTAGRWLTGVKLGTPPPSAPIGRRR